MAFPAEERKRVFITGVSGFTGKYLRESLESAGYETLGIANSGDVDAKIVQCDLSERSVLAALLRDFRPDYVVHLAAIAFVAHSSPIEFYRVNVLGTETLLRAICEADIKPYKVLLASSANIYGNATSLPIDESTTPAPTNHYANSKLAMEMISQNWFDQLPIIIARPFNYTGFGQPENFLVPKIVEHFASGAEVINLGNIDISRDITHVTYVVEAYRRLLLSPTKSVAVNVCGGQDYSIADILQCMEIISGRSIRVEIDSRLVRESDVTRLYGSPVRLKKLVGEIPSPGLRDILDGMFQKYVRRS